MDISHEQEYGSETCELSKREKAVKTCNCDAVSMLAKECIFKGITLEHGWRDLEICRKWSKSLAVSCAYGRVYQPCGPDVEPTCDMAVTPIPGKCNEGCFCPAGTVQYQDACITQELCPCTMRGKEFKPESTIKKKCIHALAKAESGSAQMRSAAHVAVPLVILITRP
ncbi:unnamed protein product [Ceratitis capitata]|uniref:(Mediterranean fruit fly) hypothetical protein n=1 Tax=Ceratitis capitata TaxID=7213 RepID=A0A811V1N8_CERCA|nr:unnamed protein product [Ceratitis capitata]